MLPENDQRASYPVGGSVCEDPNDFPDIETAGDLVLHAEVIADGIGALLLLRQSIQDETFRELAYSMTQALVLNKAVTSETLNLDAREFACPKRAGDQVALPTQGMIKTIGGAESARMGP